LYRLRHRFEAQTDGKPKTCTRVVHRVPEIAIELIEELVELALPTGAASPWPGCLARRIGLSTQVADPFSSATDQLTRLLCIAYARR